MGDAVRWLFGTRVPEPIPGVRVLLRGGYRFAGGVCGVDGSALARTVMCPCRAAWRGCLHLPRPPETRGESGVPVPRRRDAWAAAAPGPDGAGRQGAPLSSAVTAAAVLRGAAAAVSHLLQFWTNLFFTAVEGR